MSARRLRRSERLLLPGTTKTSTQFIRVISTSSRLVLLTIYRDPCLTQARTSHRCTLLLRYLILPICLCIPNVLVHMNVSCNHLEVDFGQFPSTLMYPAYGRNGVVEGRVRFKKKCSYVRQVTVKLEGLITTATSEYATVAIAGVHKTILTSQTVTLAGGPSSDSCRCISPGTEYAFSIPFPTYISGGTARLPPSFAVAHPGASKEVSYAIQVDVVRKGIFRRHEVRKIPVLYLPKTRPSVPSLLVLPQISPVSLPDRVKLIELSATWPKTCQAQSLSSIELPSIHFCLPLPRCYASGDPVPLALIINCPMSPVLTKLYASGASIQLVRRRKLWVDSGRQLNIREVTLSTANLSQRVDSHSGESYLSGRLQTGLSGRESSWFVEGNVEVIYLLRLVVRPPQDVPHLPVFRHEEIIQLTTDPYETLDVELLTGGLSEPALGLTTLRPAIALS